MDYLQTDHMYPVIRGGGDEIGNLQLLCRPCNKRKSDQTDAEFRRRYGRLLPSDGSIPRSPIPQEDFNDETQYTRAPREVRAIRAKRFAAMRRAKQQQDAGCLMPIIAASFAFLSLALLRQRLRVR